MIGRMVVLLREKENIYLVGELDYEYKFGYIECVFQWGCLVYGQFNDLVFGKVVWVIYIFLEVNSIYILIIEVGKGFRGSEFVQGKYEE